MTAGSRNTLASIVSATVLVFAAGAGGFIAYRVTGIHTRETRLVEAKAPTSAAANPESSNPQPPKMQPPPRTIPEQLPDISLADRDGVQRKLSSWKGRPLMVNFWATWCAPCRREIPLLKRLRRDRAAEGLEVVGIAVDFRDAVIQYARDIGMDYPLLIGEDDGLNAIAAFGMDTVFPFTVFADRQGRIVTLKVGELHPDEAKLILDRLRELDQGRLALPAAREQIASGIRRLAAERAHEVPADAAATH